MQQTRRLWTWAALGGAFTLALLLVLTGPADGQRIKGGKKGRPFQPPPGDKQPGPKDGTGSATSYSAIKLVENAEVQQWLDSGREYLAGKDYERAFTLLQAILDGNDRLKSDFYVQVKRFDRETGEQKVRWASAKYEANALLGSMDAGGMEAYEVRFGEKARKLLDEAKTRNDRELLADAAQRYMYTRAGGEANEMLATTFLERGQFFTAALRFERLLNRGDRLKAPDITLFKAALAYRRSGDVKNSDRIWKELAPRLARAGGLRVGEEVIATARVRKALDAISPPAPTNVHDWPLVWGDLTRSAQARGSPPMLDELVWFRKTLQDRNDETKEVDRGQEARMWLDRALDATRKSTAGLPILPGFFPIATGDRVIYRTYKDITSVFVREVKDSDGKVIGKPGEIDWKSTDFEGSLVLLLNDAKLRGTTENWLNNVYFRNGFGHLLYENSSVGVLSTDHRLVYAVDDLAVPCPPSFLSQFIWNSAQVDEKMKPLVKGNSLQAFELETGKIAFKLGGTDAGAAGGVKSDQFNESHFLGAPLPVGGKLYLLNERNDGKLRLFTIEVKTEMVNGQVSKYLPVIGPPQELGTVDEGHRVVQDMARRASTVHLAYGEGVLVCPTNAGEILGVDLTSRTLLWSYPYRQSAPAQGSMVPMTDPRFGGINNPNAPTALTYANWKVTPPVLTEGKVVFTAPDSIAVHCINLRDGTAVWNVRQHDGDLFFAGVIDSKVLVVGKNSVRAYRLDNGDLVWAIPTGDMPAGQGVASKNVYYLPLQNGQIIGIDVPRGTIKARNRPSAAGKPLGNLVFHEGAVLSQNVDEIVGYPQLSAKRDLAAAALKNDPTSLEKRTAYGELLLRDGQLQDAVNELRTVWQKNPEGDLGKRVRHQLYEAFTDLLQADFKTASQKYLGEYRALCEVPGDPKEQEFRQAKFLRIVGQGKEAEGDLVAAFKAYREFGSLPLYRTEGVPALEDPAQKVPSNVWLRGRVTAMLKGAKTVEQRQMLEAKIAEEWKAVQARGDLEGVRSFVGMFDVPFQVGKEARLELAEHILAGKGGGAQLEAELALLQLRVPGLREDPLVGGRALDALARLEMKKGTDDAMRLAVAYYKELAREFPNAVVRDGKTGAQLFKKLTGAKIFLPYMGEPASPWVKATMKGRKLEGNRLAPGVQGFLFQPRGDLAPPLRQCRLLLDALTPDNPTLRVVDLSNGTVRGDPIPLGRVPGNEVFHTYLYGQALNNTAYYPDANFRFFQGKGHLAVVQVGMVAYGIDLSAGKLLWQHNVLGMVPPRINQFQVSPDAEGNIWLMEQNRGFPQQQLMKIRVGGVGAVQASYVALTTNKGLVVLDPLRGTPLWSRAGVPATTALFGDDQHIYLVDTSANGAVGPTRVLRASDGATLKAKDFTHLYRHRVWVEGGKLLAADPAGGNVTLRLWDIAQGKDIWKQAFPAQSTVLHSQDPNLTGVVEQNGKITVVDLRTKKTVLDANVLQFRIQTESAADVKNLHKPLLLADRDRFYVVLNTPLDTGKVGGGVLSNNFSNGLRCAPVTGWICAFERKTGEFAWHLPERTGAQMLVLEQFDRLPVLIFSVRYMEHQKNPQGGIIAVRPVHETVAVDKESGSAVYWPKDLETLPGGASAPQFNTFRIDPKAGTINLIGYNGSVQFYVDDGRKRPEDAANAGQPGVGGPGAPGLPGTGARPPDIKVPAPGFRPRPPIRRQGGALQPRGAAVPRLQLDVAPVERLKVLDPAR
jgi:hypothetical protein